MRDSYCCISTYQVQQYRNIEHKWLWYLVWYDMIWYDMIRYDMIWYDLTWYDMIWYDMIWYDMIWYDATNDSYVFFFMSLLLVDKSSVFSTGLSAPTVDGRRAFGASSWRHDWPARNSSAMTKIQQTHPWGEIKLSLLGPFWGTNEVTLIPSSERDITLEPAFSQDLP